MRTFFVLLDGEVEFNEKLQVSKPNSWVISTAVLNMVVISLSPASLGSRVFFQLSIVRSPLALLGDALSVGPCWYGVECRIRTTLWVEFFALKSIALIGRTGAREMLSGAIFSYFQGKFFAINRLAFNRFCIFCRFAQFHAAATDLFNF